MPTPAKKRGKSAKPAATPATAPALTPPSTTPTAVPSTAPAAQAAGTQGQDDEKKSWVKENLMGIATLVVIVLLGLLILWTKPASSNSGPSTGDIASAVVPAFEAALKADREANPVVVHEQFKLEDLTKSFKEAVGEIPKPATAEEIALAVARTIDTEENDSLVVEVKTNKATLVAEDDRNAPWGTEGIDNIGSDPGFYFDRESHTYEVEKKGRMKLTPLLNKHDHRMVYAGKGKRPNITPIRSETVLTARGWELYWFKE